MKCVYLCRVTALWDFEYHCTLSDFLNRLNVNGEVGANFVETQGNVSTNENSFTMLLHRNQYL